MPRLGSAAGRRAGRRLPWLVYPVSLLPAVAVVAGTLGAASAERRPTPSFTIEHVRAGRDVALRTAPGGRVIARAGTRTEFGSPQTLRVAARHGSWIGVSADEVPNNRLAWVDAKTKALEPKRTETSLRVSLAHRKLELVEGTRVRRRIPIGIGRPGSPTPTGRFAITDKLSGRPYSGAYGCCILALSGHQSHVPAGWKGGNRLAIHGGAVGTATSAGCLHAPERDLRVLMRRVPLGTPIVIRKR